MSLSRRVAACALLIAASAPSPAATPDDISRSIAKGIEYLKKPLNEPGEVVDPHEGNEPGARALAGLALLEAGVLPTDPVIKSVAAKIRDDGYTQTRTYNLALGLIFLDRLGDPGDVPLIQLMGARLLVGQRPTGGWDYICVTDIPAGEIRQLKQNLKIDLLTTLKVRPPALKLPGANRLHSEVVRHALTLRQSPGMEDDNSNTQFAMLALWIGRRHGLDIERSMAFVEQRFLTSQQENGWGYHLRGPGSPSMTCAGLLGIAISLARRDERLGNVAKPAGGARATDPRETAARRGLIALAATLNGLAGPLQRGGHPSGNGDLYYLWSVERVAMIYKLERIAGVDWYTVGADSLVRSQNADGSWNYPPGPVPGTALALLFLSRSNLVKDMKSGNDDQFSELRSAARNPEVKTSAAAVPPRPSPESTTRVAKLPPATTDPAVAVAAELLNVGDADWPKLLSRLRDEKGATYTRGLVLAAAKMEGDRKKATRDALAERLTRMTAATLREMMAAEEAELRRAAVLACAMKEDSQHIPDLIARLRDEDPIVWPAARAGLKSLTSQDFGPAPGSTAEDRSRSIQEWTAWYDRQRK